MPNKTIGKVGEMIENNYDVSNVLAMSVVAKMIVNDEYY